MNTQPPTTPIWTQPPEARARCYAAHSRASVLRSRLARAGLPHATSSGGRWATAGAVVDVDCDGVDGPLVTVAWFAPAGTPDRRAQLAAAVRHLAADAGLRLRPGVRDELVLELLEDVSRGEVHEQRPDAADAWLRTA